jgi:hypothetical protein
VISNCQHQTISFVRCCSIILANSAFTLASARPDVFYDPRALGKLMNSITGIAVCCARAAIGHAAAPPSSVMNWRRLITR